MRDGGSRRWLAGVAIWVLTAGAGLAGESAPPAPAAASAPAPIWREDFDAAKGPALPDGWVVKGKLGTRAATFTVRAAAGAGEGVLAMSADRATASVMVNPQGASLKATPILRWRWRVLALPAGGDGRKPETDDQAIGIYAGYGGVLSKRSVSYRWDTVTPRAESGSCTYGAGTIRIQWFTLRNQDDGLGEWRVEERNLAADLKTAWGEVPESFYLSISCNSQYTGGKAEAELDWIELVPAPPAAGPPPP